MHFVIKVYILTDSKGEWWEFVKKDGTTRMYSEGWKSFRSADAALKYGKAKFKRFQVIQQNPPVPPSRTWEQTILHDVTL